MERLAREQIGRTTDLQRIAVTQRLVRIIDGTPFPEPWDSTPHGTRTPGLLVRDAVMMPDSTLLAGRMVTDAEGESGAGVVVMSYRLASDFARGRSSGAVVGDTLLFQRLPRQVIGVLKASENERVRNAFMPADAVTAARVTGQPDRRAQLTATARSLEGVTRTRAAIERWAARRFGVAWRDRVSVVSDEARLAQVQEKACCCSSCSWAH